MLMSLVRTRLKSAEVSRHFCLVYIVILILDNVAYRKLINGSNVVAKSEVRVLVDGEIQTCTTCIQQVSHDIF